MCKSVIINPDEAHATPTMFNATYECKQTLNYVCMETVYEVTIENFNATVNLNM